MANGINSRDKTLGDVLKTVFDRLRRLEQPTSIHIGGIGGAIGAITGYTISVNDTGQLISTSDGGTVTIIGNP